MEEKKSFWKEWGSTLILTAVLVAVVVLAATIPQPVPSASVLPGISGSVLPVEATVQVSTPALKPTVTPRPTAVPVVKGKALVSTATAKAPIPQEDVMEEFFGMFDGAFAFVAKAQVIVLMIMAITGTFKAKGWLKGAALTALDFGLSTLFVLVPQLIILGQGTVKLVDVFSAILITLFVGLEASGIYDTAKAVVSAKAKP